MIISAKGNYNCSFLYFPGPGTYSSLEWMDDYVFPAYFLFVFCVNVCLFVVDLVKKLMRDIGWRKDSFWIFVEIIIIPPRKWGCLLSTSIQRDGVKIKMAIHDRIIKHCNIFLNGYPFNGTTYIFHRKDNKTWKGTIKKEEKRPFPVRRDWAGSFGR